MPTPSVIDLSHHNTIPQSLQPANDSGIIGVIHKATEGVSVTDDKLKARRALARDAGMLFGAYHFLRKGSIRDQVAFFIDTCMSAQGEAFEWSKWLLALDYEDDSVPLDDAIEFLEELEAQTARSPLLYSGHTLKDKLGGKTDARLSGYRLWLAQYTSGTPSLPPGFDRYWLWQYTDKGQVPGINPPVDLNQAGVPLDRLVAEWTGGEPSPPTEAIVRITIDAPPGVKVMVEGIESG